MKVEAGIVLGDLNRRLDELGLAFENLGDIDRQTLAGSICHRHARHRSAAAAASRRRSRRWSSCSPTAARSRSRPRSDPAALAAARIGLGALGIVYAVTVRVVPAFTLDRIDRPRPLAETLARLDKLNASTRPLRVLRLPAHRDGALPREPAH